MTKDERRKRDKRLVWAQDAAEWAERERAAGQYQSAAEWEERAAAWLRFSKLREPKSPKATSCPADCTLCAMDEK